MRNYFVGVAVILLTSSTGFSQKSTLKLEEIMAGNEFIGHQPYDFFWGLSNDEIYFRWNHNDDLVAPYWRYNLKTEKLEELPSINS